MKIPQAVLKKKPKKEERSCRGREREREVGKLCVRYVWFGKQAKNAHPQSKNRTPQKTQTNPRLYTKVYYVRKSNSRSWRSLLK